MIHQILDYFRQTGRKVPELLPAVIFAQTELGETFDAIMRSGLVGEGWLRNHERDARIDVELADTYMMILLAAAAIEVDLDEVLTEKMLRKGWQPDPWLLEAWETVFQTGEQNSSPDPLAGSDTVFARLLREYCVMILEPQDSIEQKRSALVDQLKLQQANLDRLIAELENKD
jgi:hypothetical protein